MTWAEKLAHDFEYIADRGVRLYLEIVAETAWLVVSGRAPRDIRSDVRDLRHRPRDGRAVDPRARRDERHARPPRARQRGRGVARRGGLAARRLAIIDLEGGDQPIANEDGRIVVVQNGEIYNHASCARSSSGRPPLPHAALRHRGARPPLRGARAALRRAAARDVRGRGVGRASAAARARARPLRDQAALLPRRGRLRFASELKALPARREIDLDALEAFLAFNAIHGAATIFREVRKLPPATCWCGRRARRGSSATPRAAALEHRDEPWEALADELRERLRDSVRAHLVADVPVGVLLSGGVDSSALAALAPESTAASRRSRSASRSVVLRVELARTIARRYGTDHHELVVEPDAAELLPSDRGGVRRAVRGLSALPTYLVSQLRPEHVKVALSGEGGDELFGGYETYVADTLAMRAAAPRGCSRRWRGAAERLGRVPLDYKLKRFTRAAHLPPLERHHGWKEIFSPDARAELLRPAGAGPRIPLDVYRAAGRRREGADTLARLQDVDRAIYLVDDLLVKTDRMSMAHSLELRVPFLDPVVAELALALRRPRACAASPRSAAALGGRAARRRARSRAGARRASRSRPPRGCAGSSSRSPARCWAPTRLRRQGYFEPAAVSRLIDEHVDRREDHSRQLWGLITFSLWLEPARG
jgi:asparagine synthase (glutamine-hydrolysing)